VDEMRSFLTLNPMENKFSTGL